MKRIAIRLQIPMPDGNTLLWDLTRPDLERLVADLTTALGEDTKRFAPPQDVRPHQPRYGLAPKLDADLLAEMGDDAPRS